MHDKPHVQCLLGAVARYAKAMSTAAGRPKLIQYANQALRSELKHLGIDWYFEWSHLGDSTLSYDQLVAATVQRDRIYAANRTRRKGMSQTSKKAAKASA